METAKEIPATTDEQVPEESSAIRADRLQFLAEQAQVLSLGYE